MNAAEKNRALWQKIARVQTDKAIREHGPVNPDQARTLRLAQLTLHRWAELECGTGTDKYTVSVEREGENGDGKPFLRTQYQLGGKWQDDRRPIPDREAGALRRVKAVCEAAGLHWYYHTDPRGCALWVAAVPLDHSNYSSVGVACL